MEASVKNVVIVVLLAVIVFMSYRLAAVENQRFALEFGACPNKHGLLLPDTECLRARTRNGLLSGLLRGLTGDP